MRTNVVERIMNIMNIYAKSMYEDYENSDTVDFKAFPIASRYSSVPAAARSRC